MLLQVHLADDLVVAGPTEGLPIVVARQLVVLARSVLVARAVWGGRVEGETLGETHDHPMTTCLCM